ncbi:MAG TPA: hypothetical protein VEK76_02725 [Candidatus Binatia bacterium]|nr:hypothetical protein [Candidatus Binatia bacterium]
MTAIIDVVPARDPGWSKEAAVRASDTTEVSRLLNRLLGDLARLDTVRQPRLDYLDAPALDAVRGDPDAYQLLGRSAGSLEDGGERCMATAYWRDGAEGEVEVELEVADDEVVWSPLAAVRATAPSHHLHAVVDCHQGRIESLELG